MARQFTDEQRATAIERTRRWCAANPERAKESARKRAQRWRENNPVREKEIQARFRSSNRDARRKVCAAWREKNREYIREYDRQRRLDHTEEILLKNRKYATKRRKAEGSHTPLEWRNLCNSFHNCCAYCHQPVRLTRHHVTPLSRNGSDYISNIAPACQSCNSRIGTRIVYPEKD